MSREEEQMRIFLRNALLAAGVILAAGSPASADEFALKLPPGDGDDLTQTTCSACHSIDYLLMNSPFQTRKSWEAEVNKMINVFGADVAPDDAKAIVNYLATNMGS
jgi:mono/diheme cytochrome c family protein